MVVLGALRPMGAACLARPPLDDLPLSGRSGDLRNAFSFFQPAFAQCLRLRFVDDFVRSPSLRSDESLSHGAALVLVRALLAARNVRTYDLCLRRATLSPAEPRRSSYGPATILVVFSSIANGPLHFTFGLVGANMPSGLSLNIQACRS